MNNRIQLLCLQIYASVCIYFIFTSMQRKKIEKKTRFRLAHCINRFYRLYELEQPAKKCMRCFKWRIKINVARAFYFLIYYAKLKMTWNMKRMSYQFIIL